MSEVIIQDSKRSYTREQWVVMITSACARHGHVFPLLSCKVCNGDEDDE